MMRREDILRRGAIEAFDSYHDRVSNYDPREATNEHRVRSYQTCKLFCSSAGIDLHDEQHRELVSRVLHGLALTIQDHLESRNEPASDNNLREALYEAVESLTFSLVRHQSMSHTDSDNDMH